MDSAKDASLGTDVAVAAPCLHCGNHITTDLARAWTRPHHLHVLICSSCRCSWQTQHFMQRNVAHRVEVLPLEACGGRIRNQQPLANVISPAFKRHLRGAEVHKEIDRRESFVKGSCTLPPSLIIRLAKNGLFYLGNLDRTQCFSCGVVLRNWMHGDDVATTHWNHSPHCRMACGASPENVFVSMETKRSVNEFIRRLSQNEENVRRQFGADIECIHFFPYRKPFYEIDPRNSSGVPMVELSQRIAECWYCNGGLEEWTPADGPWVEHPHCCSGCEVFIRMRWVGFVKSLGSYINWESKSFLTNHLAYYDVASMAFAMRIGASNIRRGHIADCIEINLDLDAACRIKGPMRPPAAVRQRGSDVASPTAQRRAIRKRRSFSDLSGLPTRKKVSSGLRDLTQMLPRDVGHGEGEELQSRDEDTPGDQVANNDNATGLGIVFPMNIRVDPNTGRPLMIEIPPVPVRRENHKDKNDQT